jgi:hypothetical protein
LLTAASAAADFKQATALNASRRHAIKSLEADMLISEVRSPEFYSLNHFDVGSVPIKAERRGRWSYKGGRELLDADMEGEPRLPGQKPRRTTSFSDGNQTTDYYSSGSETKDRRYFGIFDGPASEQLSPLSFGFRVAGSWISDLADVPDENWSETREGLHLETVKDGQHLRIDFDKQREWFPVRIEAESRLGFTRYETLSLSTINNILLPEKCLMSVYREGVDNPILTKQFIFSKYRVNEIAGKLTLHLPVGAVLKKNGTNDFYKADENGRLRKMDVPNYASKRGFESWAFVIGGLFLLGGLSARFFKRKEKKGL